MQSIAPAIVVRTNWTRSPERTNSTFRSLPSTGARDEVAPIAITESFVAARPDLARLVRFEQGGHGDLWNVDRARYEAEVMAFLESFAEDEG